MNSIKGIQFEIKGWANSVYPDRTTESILLKLDQENLELKESIKNGKLDKLEVADLLILVLDLATINNIDVQEAIREKLDINYGRLWKVDRETGIMSHVKGSDAILEDYFNYYQLGVLDKRSGMDIRPGFHGIVDKEHEEHYIRGYQLADGELE